jgi:hypothetical protein
MDRDVSGFMRHSADNQVCVLALCRSQEACHLYFTNRTLTGIGVSVLRPEGSRRCALPRQADSDGPPKSASGDFGTILRLSAGDTLAPLRPLAHKRRGHFPLTGEEIGSFTVNVSLQSLFGITH